MIKYFVICLIILAAINLGFSQSVQLCTVGNSQCPDGFKCFPNTSDPVEYGKFSTDGGCIQPKVLGQECTQKSLRNVCQSGLACVPSTPEQSGNGTGTCQLLLVLNPTQTTMAGVSARPIGSNPFLICKYLPGQYYLDSAAIDQCCGITRNIPNPSTPSQNMTEIKYCDFVHESEPKMVTSPSFCGINKNGEKALWQFEYATLQATTPGLCLPPPPYDPTLDATSVGPEPKYTWDETKCQATFKNEDLESLTGLRSKWDGHGIYRFWFTSLPSANFYRVGDEAFLLAYIWLFKNTDVTSSNDVNLLAKNFAQKLYNAFDTYYSKSYSESFALMNRLDSMKECLNLQASIGFQLRYQVNDLLEEGLLGTIRSYQCGGVENVNKTDWSCTNEQNNFFANDFSNMYQPTVLEEGLCMDMLKCKDQCRKTHYIRDWNDNNRQNFIVNTVKNDSGVNLGDFFGGPYHSMGVNGLVDPPINSAWAPAKFTSDILGLFGEINSKNALSGPKLEFPTTDGREPNFHWQIIIDSGKLNQAFPKQDNIPGLSFLHYNDKMPYFTEEEKAYHLTSTISTPGISETVEWNGPLTLAGEAVRIMEQFSSADNDNDVIITQKHRNLHTSFHQDIVPYRLARLIQYYTKKLEAVQQEKTCLLDKIKILAKASGVNVDAADFDPLAVQINTSHPACAQAGRGGGGGGSDSFKAPTASPIANGNLAPNLSPTAKPDHVDQSGLGNIQGIVIEDGNLYNHGKKDSDSKVSLSTLSGTGRLSNNGRTAAARAVKDGARKQKELGLLARKKHMDENGKHPAVVAQEKIRDIAKIVFSKDMNSSPSSHSGSSHLLADAPTEGSGSGDAEVGKSAAALALEKQWGVLTAEKIKIGGGAIEKKIINPGQSATGLTPADEQRILQNIRAQDVAENEDDSLWQKLTKAYIKSYTKLFAPRERN